MRDIRAIFGIPNLPQSAVILTTFRHAVKKGGEGRGGGNFTPTPKQTPKKPTLNRVKA